MSDTTFVVMYHPSLGNVQVDAPLQAVSTYQSHGWLLLDPQATPPPVASPYLSQPAADSRYLRDWAGAEVLTAGAVRVAPDGHIIVRTADGTTRSTYDTTEQALWTVVGGGSASDSSVAALIPGPSATATALRAAYVPKWKPNTAYASGEFVLNPSGQIVSANTAFTSGASYSASNWTVVSGGGAGTAALTPTATKTAAYTAAVGELAMMNVPGGATTLTLPTAPADKAQVGYRAIGATTAVPLTVNRGGSTDTIGTAGATSASLPMADEVVVLQYDAANTRWLAVSAVKTQASLDARYGRLRTYDVKSYGAVGDVVILLDGAITSGSATLTSASSAFVTGDVGKLIAVAGAGASAAPLVTTISARVSATQVTLAATASTTVSAKEVQYGTDDSAAFAATVTAAALEPVGAIINVPAGRYFTGQNTIYTRHQWQGVGPGSSVLMLKPGSTATSILQTQNFATLTGTSTNACPIQFSIRRLSLDGNKTLAPGAGRCLEVFGFEFDIDDVGAHRAVTDGMWLEYNGPQPVSTDPEVDYEESRVSNVKTTKNGNDGFHAIGVHDSMFVNIISAQNGNVGIYAGASGNWLNCHSWGQPQVYAWQVVSNENFTNCLGEGALTANWYLAWHYAKFANCRSFAPRSTTTGVLIGKSGTILGDDTTIWGMTIEGFSASTGPSIDVTNAGARLVLMAKTDQASGTVINGSIPADAFVQVSTPTTTIVQTPGVAAATLPSQTGNAGKFLTTNGSAASWANPVGNVPLDVDFYLNGSAVIRESIPRRDVTNSFAASSGQVYYDAVVLQAGDVITKLAWVPVTVPVFGTSGYAYFLGLYSVSSSNPANLTLVARSADGSSSGGTAAGELPIAADGTGAAISSYTVPTTGVYYIARLVNNGTGGAPVTGTSHANPVTTGLSTVALSGQLRLCTTVGTALTALPSTVTLTGSTSSYSYVTAR